MNKWNICARISPQEHEEVLLTFRNTAGLHVGMATYKNDSYYYIAETDSETFETIYGVPVAWMEVPKPLILSLECEGF
jgi:hypothetical protein